MSNLAGNPNGPSLTFAGVTFTDLNSLIFIEGKVTVSGSPPYYTTVRRINGAAAAAYQVTAGKTFRWLTLDCVIAGGSSAGGTDVRFGWGDTSVENSSAAPTNAVTSYAQYLNNQNTVATYTSRAIKLDVPATKFPFVYSSFQCFFSGFGYEF